MTYCGPEQEFLVTPPERRWHETNLSGKDLQKKVKFSGQSEGVTDYECDDTEDELI